MSKKICKRVAKKTTLTSMVVDDEADCASTAVTTTEFDASFWPGRRLVLSSYKGETFIHVREYEKIGDKEYPTKKGASFTPGRLRVLREKIATIDEMLRQQEINAAYNVTLGEPTLYKAHLGAGVYVSISENYPGVSLRRHWMPEGQQEVIPTKNGIYLPRKQWTALKIKLEELLSAYPELDHAAICSNSHAGNQMEFLVCRECTPFGWLHQ